MLQNSSATKITAQTEEHVRKIFRITLTRAPAGQALLASTVNLVSSHPFFMQIVRLCV